MHVAKGNPVDSIREGVKISARGIEGAGGMRFEVVGRPVLMEGGVAFEARWGSTREFRGILFARKTNSGMSIQPFEKTVYNEPLVVVAALKAMQARMEMPFEFAEEASGAANSIAAMVQPVLGQAEPSPAIDAVKFACLAFTHPKDEVEKAALGIYEASYGPSGSEERERLARAAAFSLAMKVRGYESAGYSGADLDSLIDADLKKPEGIRDNAVASLGKLDALYAEIPPARQFENGLLALMAIRPEADMAAVAAEYGQRFSAARGIGRDDEKIANVDYEISAELFGIREMERKIGARIG